ncbi:hypothetical protein CFC21_055456 [Triticum aestivum]|uniref:Uncharacterized protein n=2 Tax=Triticum aestivum TaxID=4565 RepID=A0A9R1GF40_WHEAT|nr:hypothetical protein CFC21_055456 [Triticum aestivum]
MLHNTKNSTSTTARRLRICELDYTATAGVLNFCDALMRDYEGDKRSEAEDNDGPLNFELPECVDEANEVWGYCGLALLHMPGAEALVKEGDDLQMLMDLSIALLSPYRLD